MGKQLFESLKSESGVFNNTKKNAELIIEGLKGCTFDLYVLGEYRFNDCIIDLTGRIITITTYDNEGMQIREVTSNRANRKTSEIIENFIITNFL